MSAIPVPAAKIDFADLQLLIDSIPALIHTSLTDGYLDYSKDGSGPIQLAARLAEHLSEEALSET